MGRIVILSRVSSRRFGSLHPPPEKTSGTSVRSQINQRVFHHYRPAAPEKPDGTQPGDRRCSYLRIVPATIPTLQTSLVCRAQQNTGAPDGRGSHPKKSDKPHCVTTDTVQTSGGIHHSIGKRRRDHMVSRSLNRPLQYHGFSCPCPFSNNRSVRAGTVRQTVLSTFCCPVGPPAGTGGLFRIPHFPSDVSERTGLVPPRPLL